MKKKVLTKEVFSRPDCPKWAKWAAMDTDGRAYWYESEPELHCSGLIYTDREGTKLARIPGKFYIENKSKIKRQYMNLDYLCEHPEELAKKLVQDSYNTYTGDFTAPDGTVFRCCDEETGECSIDKAEKRCFEYTLKWLKQEHKEK